MSEYNYVLYLLDMHNKCLLVVDIIEMLMQVRVRKDILFLTRKIL